MAGRLGDGRWRLLAPRLRRKFPAAVRGQVEVLELRSAGHRGQQKTPPRLLGGEGAVFRWHSKEIIMVRARGRARAVSGTQACRDAAARPAHPPFLGFPSPTCASAGGGPMLDGAAGWALVAALATRTGRGRVRVADRDAAGAALNAYRRESPVDGPPPGRPYAVYLADADGDYWLFGCDLDSGRGPVSEDLAELRALLDRAGLPHLVSASGPGDAGSPPRDRPGRQQRAR